MTIRKRVPDHAIGETLKTSTGENQGFLNMFVGFARKPVEEWSDPLEVSNNISKKREEYKKYLSL